MSFGNGSSLRHLPFFEEVAAHEEHKAEWRAATAGLVTLRLVDAWIEQGSEVVASGSFMTNAVLKTIDQMDDGSPIPGILRSIVVAAQRTTPDHAYDVIPKILAYGRALEFEARWQLAADAYDTAVEYADPSDADTLILAHLQRGGCYRALGQFESALDAYATAGMIANNIGDVMGGLRAKIGNASVAMDRGNLPHADAAFGQVVADAAKSGQTATQVMALDGRATVAGFRGDYELAIRFGYEALSISPKGIERDRTLHNIGTAFQRLGSRNAARDAFLLLSATAQEQHARWAAMLALMTIAAEDGSEVLFERCRQSLVPSKLPPELQVEYFMHMGQGYRELGREDLAQVSLAKAVEIADRYQLSKHLFDAENALKTCAVPTVPEKREYSAELTDIAAALRLMRDQVDTLLTTRVCTEQQDQNGGP